MCAQTRPRFILSSERLFFWGGGGGVESELMLTPKEKFSSEDRTHDAASSRTAGPTHYQRAIPAPFPNQEKTPRSPLGRSHRPGCRGVKRRYLTIPHNADVRFVMVLVLRFCLASTMQATSRLSHAVCANTSTSASALLPALPPQGRRLRGARAPVSWQLNIFVWSLERRDRFGVKCFHVLHLVSRAAQGVIGWRWKCI